MLNPRAPQCECHRKLRSTARGAYPKLLHSHRNDGAPSPPDLADATLLAMSRTSQSCRWCISPLLATVLLAAGALAQNPAMAAPKPLLLVANQKDHSLSLIDPDSGTQIAAVDVGGVTGHEVTASPDGRTAYVPIYGDSGVGQPGTDGRSVAVIDLLSHKVVHTITFPHGVRPHLPALSSAGRILYVTSELDQTITAFDPHTYKVLGTIPTGEPQSHMFALSHNGHLAYTANVGSGTVSVLDLETRKTLAIIPVAPEIQRISISRDDRLVFTSDQTKPQLAAIDTATRTIKQWIPLPATGYGTASTIDGHYLLVALRSLNKVAIVDLATMKVTRTLDMPGTPVEILVRPDGQDAYVSCGKQVAVILLPSFKVSTPLEAGNGADGLAWAQ